MKDKRFSKRIISSGTLVLDKETKKKRRFPTEKEADEYIDEKLEEDKRNSEK